MRIPKQILNLLDDKLKAQLLEGNTDETSLVDLLVKAEPKDVKERVEVALNNVYEQYGYNTFLGAIQHLKTFRNRELQDTIQAKGEVAEVVLVIMLKEFIKIRKHSDWKVYKGLMLGKLGNSTELDLILCTPSVVNIIEVKSYSGKKSITEQCTLVAKRTTNVWSQNVHHIKYFWATFKKCCYNPSDKGIIKSALFSFSAGELCDSRGKEWQKIMPVLEVETLVPYLLSLENLSKVNWDLEALAYSVGIVAQTAPSMEQHIAYLKSKHREVQL